MLSFQIGCDDFTKRIEDFPVTEGALQKKHAGKGDAFIVKLVLEDGH